MEHRSSTLPTVVHWCAAAALSIGLSACAALPATGADTWTEEVLLHNGQKIVVERSQTYKGRSEPGQRAPIGEHTIRFSLPGSSKVITWTSEYAPELGRTDFNLSALHVKDNIPYVVAEPNLCLSYNKWGRPNPPYVVFRYEGNTWQRIAFDELLSEFTTVNVVKRIRGIDVEKLVQAKQVSAEQVAKLNADLERPESRAILREAMKNPSPGCPAMFANSRGQWQGSGWFTNKPNLQACESYCKAEHYDETNCPCKKLFERK